MPLNFSKIFSYRLCGGNRSKTSSLTVVRLLLLSKIFMVVKGKKGYLLFVLNIIK